MSKQNKKSIEIGYQRYLKLVKLVPENMSEVQKQETKRAYYAGYATSLVDHKEIITKRDFAAIEDLHQEANKFWSNEG